VIAQLNQTKGELEERENQAVLEELLAEVDGEEADYYNQKENNDEGEQNCEESKDEDSDLIPQPSGIFIVPPSKSKWTVFLDD